MKFTKILYTILVAFAPLMVNAQSESDSSHIKAIGDKACECTREIDTDMPKDSIVEKINSCISAYILEDQLMKTTKDLDKLVGEAVAAKGDTIVGAGETITIYADKDFEEIQSYMFENCSRVKTLIALNNKKTKYSMSENKKALKYYQEADEHYKRDEYDVALVGYNKAVKEDPKFAFAWDNMGICYRKLGNYKKAIECYQQSLKVDPEGRMPLQNMAVAYEYLKDYKQAAETYLTFIKLYPDDPEGYFGAGRILYLSDEYEQGVDNMFKAYLLYEEKQSPYINDAVQNLKFYYSDLEKKGKLDIFKQAAKNNNIPID